METIINYLNEVYDPTQRIILLVGGTILFVAMIVCAILGVVFSIKKRKRSRISEGPTDAPSSVAADEKAESEIPTIAEEDEKNTSTVAEERSGVVDPPAPLGKPKISAEKGEPTDPEDQPEKKTGKWEISQVENAFVAVLYSAEGKKLLTTTEYTGLSGIKSAVTTVIKNLAEQNAAVTVDKEGVFRIKVFSTSGKLLAYGEPEKIRYYCERDLKRATECKDGEQMIISRS